MPSRTPLYAFPANRRKIELLRRMPIVISAVILLLDQISKFIALSILVPGQSVPLIGNFVRFSLVMNEGAAFGLFAGFSGILLVTNIIVVIALLLIIFLRPSDDVIFNVSAGLLLGGSAGNAIDRLRFGAVVDFLDIGWWPAFNVADASLVVGIGLLVGYLLGIFRQSNERDGDIG